MRWIASAAICLELLACAAPSTPVLSSDGYGPIKFDTRLSDVEKLLGAAAVAQGPADPACTYISFASLPHVRFMVENGIVTRAEVEAGVPNTFGIAVGTSLADVQAKQPDVVIQPHKYDPAGHYLIFADSGKTKAVVMEETGGKVSKVRGGVQPAVEYVEGCQ
jgi:hypothetical protein